MDIPEAKTEILDGLIEYSGRNLPSSRLPSRSALAMAAFMVVLFFLGPRPISQLAVHFCSLWTSSGSGSFLSPRSW